MAEGKVYNVRIKSESARVVEEKQSTIGQSTAVNEADVEAAISLTDDCPNHEFRASQLTSIGSVVVSIPAINGPLVWGETKEEKRNTEVSATVVVPKKSKITCEYSVSHSRTYTLDDKNITSEHSDGIYTVVQFYDFHFKNEIQPL